MPDQVSAFQPVIGADPFAVGLCIVLVAFVVLVNAAVWMARRAGTRLVGQNWEQT